MIAALFLAASQAMTFTADRIAADGETRALTATGHVEAAAGPVRIRGDFMTRDADGKMVFRDPTCATTCTNAPGHTHWNVSGEVEYLAADHVILRNAKLRFWEVPVFWLPYLYYPLDEDCGFRWMPGYMSRWGAYLLTRYAYDLVGTSHDEGARWLDGATRLDLRSRQGVAVGEEFGWGLGDFGRGGFSVYFAWDQDVDDHDGRSVSDYSNRYHSYNWESPVDWDRYSVRLWHRWEMTERDTVRASAAVFSDSSFRNDFERSALFGWKSRGFGYQGNGVFWEHVENALAVGAEVSGRLNDFYGMTDRLPEIYLDVHPLPLFGLPVNYETENRLGYLRRHAAEYGTGSHERAFSYNPGPWAYYDAFRLDTYHRLTSPFKVFDDVLSAVPRVGYRGTGWSESGKDCLTGWERSSDSGESFRSVVEGGVTFAARATGWVDDVWRHMAEPYVDVLAQEAWLSGSGDRPYVFDNLDASVMWEDQFAGRARNLPYSYYGVTPGLRNAWEALDEHGRLRQVLDVDVYAALQFNSTSYEGAGAAHKLARVGRPNYGEDDVMVAPGARVRWTPDDDVMLMGCAEYDSDNNRLARADIAWKQRISETFRYDVRYDLRDYRWWDFSSAPYSPEQMKSDDMNYAKYQFVHVGFEHQPIDWLAWGPFVRWDIKEGGLDSVGTWIDYLTDCLGFRFIVEYEDEFTQIDGYRHKEDWSFGFYIYLRAFGADSSPFIAH